MFQRLFSVWNKSFNTAPVIVLFAFSDEQIWKIRMSQPSGSTLIHKEHSQSRALQLQFPVAQSIFGYAHLRQQLLGVHLSDCPTRPGHVRCVPLKVHFAGELVAHLHSEPSLFAVAPVGAGEVEVHVDEVHASLFGLHIILRWVELKEVPFGRPVAILHHIPGHGLICHFTCKSDKHEWGWKHTFHSIFKCCELQWDGIKNTFQEEPFVRNYSEKLELNGDLLALASRYTELLIC